MSPDSLFQQALPSFCSVQSLLPAYFGSVKMARRTKIFSPAHATVQQAPLLSAPYYRRTATYSYILTHTHTHTHTHTIAAVLATNTKYSNTQFYVTRTDTSVLWQQTDSIAPKPATTLITVSLHQSSSYLWPKYLSSTTYYFHLPSFSFNCFLLETFVPYAAMHSNQLTCSVPFAEYRSGSHSNYSAFLLNFST